MLTEVKLDFKRDLRSGFGDVVMAKPESGCYIGLEELDSLEDVL
jgi:hypothetical protein